LIKAQSCAGWDPVDERPNVQNVTKMMETMPKDAQMMSKPKTSDPFTIPARKPVHTHTPFPRSNSERISGFTDP